MKTIAWRATGAVIFLLAVLGSVNLGIWVMDREPPIQFETERYIVAIKWLEFSRGCSNIRASDLGEEPA